MTWRTGAPMASRNTRYALVQNNFNPSTSVRPMTFCLWTRSRERTTPPTPLDMSSTATIEALLSAAGSMLGQLWGHVRASSDNSSSPCGCPRTRKHLSRAPSPRYCDPKPTRTRAGTLQPPPRADPEWELDTRPCPSFDGCRFSERHPNKSV